MNDVVPKPWLDHYPSAIPTTIDYQQQPLHSYLKNAAENYPDMKALHFLGKELTFQDLYEKSIKFANYLLSLGIRKGDRVGIMLPNCPQAVISYYGILMTGAIVVQINPLYTERELILQLSDSGAKMIVCLDLLYPKILRTRSKTKVEHIIVTGIKDYLPFPKNVIYPFIQKREKGITVRVAQGNYTHLFKYIMKTSSTNEIDVDINPKEDLALLQYTGGTTGQAKGVELTHFNLVSNTLMCKHWMYKCKEGQESILGILPFFHVFGMTVVMNLSIMFVAKMIILPKFEPQDALKTIQKQKPTIFPGAPTIYIALVNHPSISEYDLTSINTCISGSAPLPLEIQDKFEELTGGRLVEGFGLTEASPVTHANDLWGHRVKGSVGIPWPDTEAFILSAETNQPAEVNEIGELLVRGPQVMKGYWKQPEETKAVFFDEDWLKTGDLGYMDENGYFFIKDRKKDMIIAGGFNIYPREVEEVLYEHEKIQEAVVLGVPDSYRGETVKAYIVLKERQHLTERELDAFLRKYLAAYKVPKIYEFREELPKTAIGKILRRALLDEEKEKQAEDL